MLSSKSSESSKKNSISRFVSYITKEITITPPTPKPRHWGLGLQVGYGITISNSQIKPAPYIGISLSYSIINETCSLSAEAESR